MGYNNYERRQFSRLDLSDRSIGQNLVLAGQIQRSFLPSATQCLKGFELAGQSISCIEVGGDYFDYLYGPDFQDDSLKVIVGDVSGHGIDAALLMSSARTFIRTRATFPGKPAEVVSDFNRYFYFDNSRTGYFMTLFYLDVDLVTGDASWVRAGHDPALVFNPQTDRFKELKGIGLPLGVDNRHCYREYPLPKLPEGTIIALGTDGIWDARNEKEEYFGKDHFRNIIRETAMLSAQEIVTTVLEELGTFCRGVPLDDDVTLVIVKVI
ncbi:MAG: serine/threonine-protein phosphatase [Desulfobulbaceae bacterium]|nr:serine/threonine-protein phosphatase [Desulfobulbaceae bacterium]